MAVFHCINCFETINEIILLALEALTSPKLNSQSVSFFSFLIHSITMLELKFMLILSFLITIRVGTPRYRYDFLSKLGWLKLLSVSLASFTLLLLWIVI